MPTAYSAHRPDDSMPPTQLVASGGPPPRKVLILVGLIVALVVVLLGTAALLQGPRTPNLAVAATATYALLPTGVPVTPGPVVIKGWTVKDSSYSAVAFAPSLPHSGYACGAPDANARTGFGFGVSSDGGTTWKMLPSPQGFVGCSLNVSATNPHAIALLSQSCFNVCYGGQSAPAQVYLSGDGGARWVQGVIPPGLPANSENALLGGIWSGSDYYSLIAADRAHAVVVSHNGSDLRWLDLTTLFAQVPDAYQIGSFDSSGADLLATLVIPQCPPSQAHCTIFATSADHGATWTKTPLTVGAPELNLLDAPAGAPLLGNHTMPQGDVSYLRSFDHGQTWLPLPKFPAGYLVQDFNQTALLFEAPDGTIFANTTPDVSNPNAPNTVVRLKPGASTWELFAQLPGQVNSVGLVALTTDAQGHPQNVWGAWTVGGLIEHSAT